MLVEPDSWNILVANEPARALVAGGEGLSRVTFPQIFSQDSRPIVEQALATNAGAKHSLMVTFANGAVMRLHVSRLDDPELGRKSLCVFTSEALEPVPLSEVHFEELVANASDIIYTHDLAGNITSINAAATRIMGYTPEEAARLNLADLVLEEDLPRARAAIEKKLTGETGETAPYELRVRRKNGEIAVMEVNTRLIVRDGQPAAVQGIARDVTERVRTLRALQESEAKFRAVADTAASAIYIHDGERFLYVNRASQEISGYTAEELLNMAPMDIVAPKYREMVRARAQARREGQSVPSRYEFPILMRSGEQRWVDFSAGTIDFGGKTAILATAFDITERKQAERMQATLYRIAEITSAVGDDMNAFYAAIHKVVAELIDARNFYIALYDAAAQTVEFVYGVDEKDTFPAGPIPLEPGLTGYVLRTEKPLLATPEIFEQLVAAGEVEPLGVDCVDWLGVPLKVEQKTIGVLVTQSYDRSVRFNEKTEEMLTYVSQHIATAIACRRDRDALQASEARYRNLVESAVYGMLRSAPDQDRFLDANPALLAMLGYESQAELTRASIARDIAADPGDCTRLMAEMQSRRVVNGYDTRWKRKDGKLVYVRLSARANFENGHVSTVDLIVEDITERRSLEEQLRQAQKMEAVGRLAGGVAHDFNNLLTIIKGYGELMLEQLSPSDPLRSEVEEVRKAADRAASLTRQLLAFSRQQVLAPKVVDLNNIVANMDKMLRRLMGEDVQVATHLDPQLGRIKADPGQVEQVIMNLAVNARDAMPTGGKLTIVTGNIEIDPTSAAEHLSMQPGSYVMLAVSDSGTGMDEETRLRVFEPFFTTKESGKGTGLGLSTVYGIVKQSGGYIWAYSELNVGSTFKVYFPRVHAPVEFSSGKTSAAGQVYLGHETILLVEDEDGVRGLVREVLQKNGYHVLECRHGGEALQLCERHGGKIHLLLTDVVLEHMSGRELSTRLTHLRPDMRVIYMSGYTPEAIVHHGVLAPGTAFLQKPFTTQALARKVREVLDGEGSAAI